MSVAHQALDLALGVDFVVKGARSFTAGMMMVTTKANIKTRVTVSQQDLSLTVAMWKRVM